ncbi:MULTISPECIES: acyl-CoA dehydrogenase family protein [unclassified Nocardioides]|uniref:acyl-CoA dehydrogenase family protein n=1 Tax=unclassified Nocardioides TaxID=2615069 RepID=UPI00360F3F7A
MAPTKDLEEIRGVVRGLLDEWLDAGRFTPACDSWLRRYSIEFSRAMGSRGLIGLSWPREYGGGAHTALARLVVTEELLRSGAPVAAHWIADRQIGPSILRHGTEEAKQRYLPGIASAEITFCLGMSETEAGSDLASVRTTATRTDGGWSITGRKIWTSQGHRSTHAYVLARTETSDAKHEGLSEFVVNMSAPGVEVRPIHDLSGEHHFNEITFDGVRVPDGDVLGVIGEGWRQVTAQLSLERGGIERVLSTYPLLAAATDAGHEGAAAVGRMHARLATLRRMAVEVAARIDAGASPVFEAAVLKDLGTAFECDVNEFARGWMDVEASLDDGHAARLLAQGTLAAPGFTIRGGTSEVLRTLIARGAGRGSSVADEHELRGVVDDVLDDRGGDPDVDDRGTWELLERLGWPGVGVPEEAGGSGGDLADLSAVVEGLGRHAVSAPIAETAVAGRALARAGVPSKGVLSVAVGSGTEVTASSDGADVVLDGVAVRVPWGRWADDILVAVELDGRSRLVRVGRTAPGVGVDDATNLAGEPRDRVTFDRVRLPSSEVLTGVAPDDVVVDLALLRAVAMIGALETALARTVEHAQTREQFGRPLMKFQAIAGLVASAASLHALARLAVARAVAARGSVDAWAATAAARVVVGSAATEVARIAHQVHAAMGVTREHPLHLSTRRLWSWRDEVGTERAWAERLGTWIAGLDEEARWRWVTERPTAATTPNRHENEGAA